MAINAAQRQAIQRGLSKDANAFAAALRDFGIRTQEETKLLAEAAVGALYESIVHGSPITNSPGQPVDTGELRDSWKIERLSPTRWKIYTNSPYARAIEHNWRKISRAKIKWAKEALGIKRLTKSARATIRRGFGGIRFRGRGGAHSLKLTIQGFPLLVRHLIPRVFGATTRNIGGGVHVKGVGIRGGSSGAPR